MGKNYKDNEYTMNLSINMMKSPDDYAVADNIKCENLNFTELLVWGDVKDNCTDVSLTSIQNNPDGLYEYRDFESQMYNYRAMVALTPLRKCNIYYYSYVIVFTPSEDFEGFYDFGRGGVLVTYSGDTIVPGDGKTYILHGYYDFQTSTPIITVCRLDKPFPYKGE